MANTVFISYAGNDPQWPAETVHALGLELEKLGATVLLDQFFRERQDSPGKLPPVKWRDWMKAGIKKADRVICLASARYAQAVERDLNEDWGYGVAYESLKFIGTLYEDKGHNLKGIVTVRPDGSPTEQIPEDLRQTCPEYQWPKERIGLLEHAIGRRLNESGNGAAEPPPADANKQRIDDGLAAQAELALERLQAQPDFFKAIVAAVDRKVLAAAPREASGDPKPFIEWLSNTSRTHAQKVMWAVRKVLNKQPGYCADGDVQKAVIAVYMLCTLRWVERTALGDGTRVVTVPQFTSHLLAVLSVAFFGGRIEYARKDDDLQPLGVYRARPTKGESASTELLRAIYCELFAHDKDTLKIAQCDDDESVKKMEQGVRFQLNEIREVQDLGVTLIIDRSDAVLWAEWADKFEVIPFVVDKKITEAVFLIDHHELEHEIKALLRLLQHPGAARTAPESSS